MWRRLQTKWRDWRASRRDYALERALYKASGHKGVRGGGFEGKDNYGDGPGPGSAGSPLG